jgi:anti-sigma factor RsiW
MKCFERERLVEYACGLMEDSYSVEVREHLEKCSACRGIVEQHQHLGSVLDEWKVEPPAPWFDAQVRQAVESDRAGSRGWVFGDWVRSLALASLGIIIVAGAVWYGRNHRPPAKSSESGANVAKIGTPPATVNAPVVQPSVQTAQVKIVPVQPPPKPGSSHLASSEDRAARALDDYDLAANFDVLSEVPMGETRVAN